MCTAREGEALWKLLDSANSSHSLPPEGLPPDPAARTCFHLTLFEMSLQGNPTQVLPSPSRGRRKPGVAFAAPEHGPSHEHR